MIYWLAFQTRWDLSEKMKEGKGAWIECIFYLDWALKSGYATPAPEHDCQRSPLTEIPPDSIQVQMGYMTLSAQECHQLACEAFGRFKDMRGLRNGFGYIAAHYDTPL